MKLATGNMCSVLAGDKDSETSIDKAKCFIDDTKQEDNDDRIEGRVLTTKRQKDSDFFYCIWKAGDMSFTPGRVFYADKYAFEEDGETDSDPVPKRGTSVWCYKWEIVAAANRWKSMRLRVDGCVHSEIEESMCDNKQ